MAITYEIDYDFEDGTAETDYPLMVPSQSGGFTIANANPTGSGGSGYYLRRSSSWPELWFARNWDTDPDPFFQTPNNRMPDGFIQYDFHPTDDFDEEVMDYSSTVLYCAEWMIVYGLNGRDVGDWTLENSVTASDGDLVLIASINNDTGWAGWKSYGVNLGSWNALKDVWHTLRLEWEMSTFDWGGSTINADGAFRLILDSVIKLAISNIGVWSGWGSTEAETPYSITYVAVDAGWIGHLDNFQVGYGDTTILYTEGRPTGGETLCEKENIHTWLEWNV